MAATAMAAATVASLVKAVGPMDKPEAMAADHAVKAVVRVVVKDATAVADAVDGAVTVNARVAHNASVLTPKAKRCQWTPTCKWVDKTQLAQMPIAQSHALSVLRANVVNAAGVVVVVVNALRTASVTNQSVQKAATSLVLIMVSTTPLATRAVSPAKVVVKVAKVATEAEVVAMAVVRALKVTHATQTVKTPSRPNRVSQTQTQRLLL